MKKALKKVEPINKSVELVDLAVAKFELTAFPWPYADGTVKEIHCFHKLEYVPAKLRIPVMEEMWRVLEVGGKATIVVCYWTSPRAIQDPAAEWPPFSEQSFLYFNKGWREANQLAVIGCDFDFTYGYQVDGETAARNQEAQGFWIKHYLNTANDLQLALTKRA